MGPKKPHSTTKPPSKSSTPPTPPTNWPIFKPLLPVSDLSLQTLVPSQIITIPYFWTSTLCKNYVNFLKTLPLTTTPVKPKKGDALRFNDRFQVIDERFANRLWEESGLRELVCGSGDENEGDEERMSDNERRELWGGEVVGLNPSIRVYRYSKGQFFDQHYDESNVLTLNTKPSPTPVRTTWTLLLYLTSPATGCQGGETVFYPGDLQIPGRKTVVEKEIVVGLETGMVLLHKHGNDCMLHEGRAVTDGEKWIIRTDLCVKREKSRFAE
ncbi:uncharacterized protein LY89DRAFT_712093 [Mollisia scopiformis]|uniref:Fe2OG dioxygenase domain-containing protein n=1 Tax=Mollisia scopiformis TaxID=149040 RepID=A0A132B4E8_MOLSC|nr:uncharacterized protein LY89DRAFT_712093 [Mollisia scopiformis]KUJ07266.1 hypothetical protein LY89DRAFT_712093 [Mollisia scopiformis]